MEPLETARPSGEPGHSRRRNWLLLAAAGLVLGLVFGLWVSRPSIQLPAGYQIFFASSSEVFLEDPQGEIVVGASLAELNSEAGLIVGRNQPRPGDSQTIGNAAGYFVIETATGHITRGLSRDAWIQRLRELGVPGVPLLHPPEFVFTRK